MSSAEESQLNHRVPKKRRLRGACDVCRHKKVRCDSAEMPNNRCSNCSSCGIECTHLGIKQKTNHPKEYVEKLEARNEKMRNLLVQLAPGVDIDRLLESDLNNLPSPGFSRTRRSPPFMPPILPSAKLGDTPPSEDDDFEHIELAQQLEGLNVSSSCGTGNRFFGKSSGFNLMKTAMDLKDELVGGDTPKGHLKQRPEYWGLHPWEKFPAEDRPSFIFPGPDLLSTLTNEYFNTVNTVFSLLHQPTFERQIKEGFHLRDYFFGCVVLLVCSIAAKQIDDPRVLADGYADKLSAGHKYFVQVQLIRRNMLDAPTLYELQSYALYLLYLISSSMPQATYLICGIALRLCVEAGVHRRNPEQEPSVENELWKRAFWVLLTLDRGTSSFCGRPCALHDEQFDQDLPLEVDDEYWESEDPAKRFKQPEGKPSKTAAFNSLLKLYEILGLALRTIYAINKGKVVIRSDVAGKSWEQDVVAELDSALNNWVDSVPDHLRWDPHRKDPTFFSQSAMLYTLYYHLQIIIHRQFIPTKKKPSPLSFPSLAICTNAARCTSHILSSINKRPLHFYAISHIFAFTSGTVLLLNLWVGKQNGLYTDPQREMRDVYKCLDALEIAEKRWHTAGRFLDILRELATMGHLPTEPPNRKKRSRNVLEPELNHNDSDLAPASRETSASLSPNDFFPMSPSISPDSPPTEGSPDSGSSGSPWVGGALTMPLYSNELGSLPVFGADPVPSSSSTIGVPSFSSVNGQNTSVNGISSFGLEGNEWSNPYPSPGSPQVDAELAMQYMLGLPTMEMVPPTLAGGFGGFYPEMVPGMQAFSQGVGNSETPANIGLTNNELMAWLTGNTDTTSS